MSSASAPKRNSLGSAQLPLPPSLNAPASPSKHPGHFIPPPSSPTRPQHPIRIPVSEPSQQPNSPISPSFPVLHSPPAIHSSTHAGGIQPSASFFRPSRPSYQPQYSRPSSASSTQNPHNAEGGDGFAMAPISHHGMTTSSFDDTHSLNGGPESMLDDSHHGFLSLKRIKQSREPLLPLSASGRAAALGSSNSARPSISRDHSAKNASKLVRSSLDRVLSISRGISFDSIRKSTSTRNIHHSNPAADPNFETKISDEDAAYSPSTPASPYTKKPPHLRHHDHFPHKPSLDVRNSRHSAALSAASPSLDPSFIPSPPHNDPPLSAIPHLNEKTGKPYRRYQLHPSRNRFLFGGRLLTGGDTPWAFIGSFTLLLSVAGVWFGTTAVWWWKNKSPAIAGVGAYMALLTISTMLATATVDPGILPRNLDPEPPYPATSPSDGGVRAPMPRDLKVRSDVVRVKYCPTCKTYRPPRSSHCKMCDNCVDGCDHHCQWVNNCIGRRNYTTFFALLVSTTITLVLIIVTSALHLWFLTQRQHVNFRKALAQGAGSAVAFSLSIAVIWPVAALLTYHMRLLLLNITTIEQIRNQAHKTLVPGPPPPNPFSHGSWRKNLIAVLCRPVGFSWLDSRGIVTVDRREINPGALAMGGKEGGGVWDGQTQRQTGKGKREGETLHGHGHGLGHDDR